MTETGILDVDLLAFEQGSAEHRRAVVDGVRRSLATGFVYTTHDLSEDLLDTAYEMLARFFSLPTETTAAWAAPATSASSPSTRASRTARAPASRRTRSTSTRRTS